MKAFTLKSMTFVVSLVAGLISFNLMAASSQVIQYNPYTGNYQITQHHVPSSEVKASYKAEKAKSCGHSCHSGGCGHKHSCGTPVEYVVVEQKPKTKYVYEEYYIIEQPVCATCGHSHSCGYHGCH